jgi:predicted GNAT family acetyltransferase
MPVRILGPGDENRLEGFLVTRPAQSMFLRANLRRAGIVDTGAAYTGTYAGEVAGDELRGAGAFFWNGMMCTAAGDHAGPIAAAAVVASGRPLRGFLGPWAEVQAARAALGLTGARAELESREDLFELDLAALVVPAKLAGGTWICRAPLASDLPLLARWRADYHVEALGATPGPALDEEARREVSQWGFWVLVAEGERVAMTAFNARLPDMVQVGGVYTPPELRGRGYARAAVAGSLLDARAGGAGRAILFTGDDNVAARTAYLALGFQIVGDYGMVLGLSTIVASNR